jgi:hypothetical protein
LETVMTEQLGRDPAVDTYLESVGGRLRRMPPERRAEELRELGQHLDLLVVGYRTQGLTPQAAAAAAVERFGRAEDLGRELHAAVHRPARGTSPLYYLGFCVIYGVVIAMVHLGVLAVIDAPLNLPDRLGDRLGVVAWPALLIPPLFVLHDVWRRRRDVATSGAGSGTSLP